MPWQGTPSIKTRQRAPGVRQWVNALKMANHEAAWF